MQGVGFRFFVENTARSIQVRGWVRNLLNGDVEVHVEGEAERVEKLIRKLRQGPPMATVTDLDCSETEIVGHRDFSIRR